MDSLSRRVFPRARQLIPAGSRILVGTSGGPDSQVLLSVLKELRDLLEIRELLAVGIDHGLRPEAEGELAVASSHAQKLGIDFIGRRVCVASSGNLMEKARHARYEALEQVAKAREMDLVALGHTLTDQAETVVHHLTRGAGLQGARGMLPKRGLLVRPLLQATRTEILEYLARTDTPFAQDPSNLSTDRTRTRIRSEVLPVLRDINPRMEQAFDRFATLAREDDECLNSLAAHELAKRTGFLRSIDIEGLDSVPRPVLQRMFRAWFADANIRLNHEHLCGLLDQLERGALDDSLPGPRLHLESGRLWRALPTHGYDIDLPIPREIEIPVLGGVLRAQGSEGRGYGPEVHATSSNGAVAFDAERLHHGLRMRPWRHGDRLHAFGLDGHVKVGDLFTNKKMPNALRAHWPVVIHGDEIVWVVGLRRAAFAPVTPATRRLVTLDIQGGIQEDIQGALPVGAC